ncbi:hypothetical protein BDB01DRAFT_539646 [Pilobolus umbonatus]|nr:hypothetical protein BDB01DRAFT_539646 [Pilobolus umbonatus]
MDSPSNTTSPVETPNEVVEETEVEKEFGDFEDTLDAVSEDEFGEFDAPFDSNSNDDDFGDFEDFEDTLQMEDHKEDTADIEAPLTQNRERESDAALFTEMIVNNPLDLSTFMTDYLDHMWDTPVSTEHLPITTRNENQNDILNTPCSRELWGKLSRDTVFFNPVTGAVGQFQWTRSETNRLYLNALGVTFISEDTSPSKYTAKSTGLSSPTSDKKRQSNYLDIKSTGSSAPAFMSGSHTYSRSASASVATGGQRTPKPEVNEGEVKKEVEQELELDIDIARAYCELTEETIRVFPNVKLNAMVTELTRLQKQTAEYLENLLDQREQLLMDAETYNDLISCIVGHAQRLREQNVNKDASPAMVTKKKKTSGTFSNMMRRKPANTTAQSASMGGGVIGVKQSQASKGNMASNARRLPTAESRRSM